MTKLVILALAVQSPGEIYTQEALQNLAKQVQGQKILKDFDPEQVIGECIKAEVVESGLMIEMSVEDKNYIEVMRKVRESITYSLRVSPSDLPPPPKPPRGPDEYMG